MKRKFLFALAVLISVVSIRCGTKTETTNNQATETYHPKTDTVVLAMGANNKGIGRFKNVVLTHPLEEGLVSGGQSIYDAKCSACHKLTNESLVGPGWKGVTDRRTPEWIMNFVTNTSVMIDSDLVAQAMMVTCLVRMPSQDLTDEQARQALEFMRKNDGKN